MMEKYKGDMALGFVISGIGLLALILSWDIPGGSATFPRILGGVILSCGAAEIILCLSTLRIKGKTPQESIAWQILAPAVMVMIIAGMLKTLGFYVCSFIAMMFLLLYEEFIERRKPTLRRMLFLTACSALTAVACYVVFGMLLAIPTPRGFFGF